MQGAPSILGAKGAGKVHAFRAALAGGVEEGDERGAAALSVLGFVASSLRCGDFAAARRLVVAVLDVLDVLDAGKPAP